MMALVRSLSHKVLRLLTLFVVPLLTLALLASPAIAREYEVGAVDIDATVNPDGSLSVVQQRTYDFQGSFNGILWDVPRGTYRGRPIESSINWVGAITSDGLVLFEEGYDGAPGTYELTDGGDYWGLKMCWPAEDESVTFQVSYNAPDLVTRWADVGELYWQYVFADPDSEGEWKNVSMKVQLPVPDGTAVVPGENVRAWGHGPIDGSLTFEGDGVRYFSPGVGAAEFLEARVTFPGEWLTGVEPGGESHLEDILKEEEDWAKDANAKRLKARMIVYGIPGSMVLAAVASLLGTWWVRGSAKRKAPKPQFHDTYFRDVPTNDHPAVLGMLYRDGKGNDKDFSASLMRLADEGRVMLDTAIVERKTKRGGTSRKQEWRMLLRKDAPGKGRGLSLRAGGKAIDDAAFDFLYNVVADKHKHVMDQLLVGPNGEPYVIKAFFDETAESWPQAYSGGYNRWRDAVRSAYGKRKFERELEGAGITGVLGLGDFALAVILAIVGMLLGVPNLWNCIAFVVLFAAGLAIVLTEEDTPTMVFTQEAVDIKAQLEALKRWLTDFTRLEEAIPTDVVLWNRLLVMATVLGVADKVVEQLRVYAPELARDPALNAMRWYGEDVEGSLKDPLDAFTGSAAAAYTASAKSLHHEVSTYDTSRSSNSSSRGRGGGFSSGGGGGYSGGGGRGGAF